MIRLAVQEYCQACNGFQPIVMESAQVDEGGNECKVYEVRCERWELCANVARMSRGMSMEAGKSAKGNVAADSRRYETNVVNLAGETIEVR